MRLILIAFFISSSFISFSQEVKKYRSERTRILFVIDGSGSMNELWGEESKFEIAKDLIIDLIDSLGKENDHVEFGVRVFGHQSPRAANDCNDSKLEIGFGEKDIEGIREKLDLFTPQGHTPIAHSIFLAASDFPKDEKATNAIILVTDGKENCEGNPCAAAEMLERNRVALRPFIIGLNLELNEALNFDCVGPYFDAKDKETFNDVVDVVISQAIKSTTVQINLLDKQKKPTISNIPITLYDHYSREILYNFVHGYLPGIVPDTLWLDPTARYLLEVHTNPPIIKSDIELATGKHNIIAVDVPKGTLQFSIANSNSVKDAVPTLIREANSPNLMFTQEMKRDVDYIEGDFDFEILTLPRTYFKSEYLEQQSIGTYEVAEAGMLSVLVREKGIAGVFAFDGELLKRVTEIKDIENKEVLSLQPGEYMIVFRPNKERKADLTKSQLVNITSGRNTTVRF
ncbi:MAG: VWA domain-containing protein [Chitinophagales bacterium]|nr:VWA domain-containing protein [Chitinophagales bacterium]